MFKNHQKKDKRTNLEREIDSILCRLATCEPDTEEYKRVAENVILLHKALDLQPKRHASKDTWLVVGGNLLLGLLVLNHEKANVITSKIFQFVLKGRV